MTCMDIKFTHPHSVPEIYADYVVVSKESYNVCIKFYRQRPLLEKTYDISDVGEVLLGEDEEMQSFEAVLQASLVLPLDVAYTLLCSLEKSGIKARFEAQSRQIFSGAGDRDDE